MRLRRFPLRTAGPVLAAAVALPLLMAAPAPAQAVPLAQPTEQGLLCRAAIQAAERGSGLPPHLLAAIAHVESGRPDPVTGRVSPWPWTINAEGKGYFFDSKAQAITFAQQLRARGVQSFDVGCMQINMMHHPDAFPSLDQAFDPMANARYAVQFLSQLKDKTGSWDMAAAWYHSATPEVGMPYRNMVMTAMANEARDPSLNSGLPDPNAASRPALFNGGGAPIRSMPMTIGTMITMAQPRTGVILPQPDARFAGVGTAGSAASAPAAATAPGGGNGMYGRGLDSYRLRPVTILRAPQVASR